MYNPHPKNVISIKCSNYFRVQIGKEQIIETTMDSNSLLKRQNLFFFSLSNPLLYGWSAHLLCISYREMKKPVLIHIRTGLEPEVGWNSAYLHYHTTKTWLVAHASRKKVGKKGLNIHHIWGKEKMTEQRRRAFFEGLKWPLQRLQRQVSAQHPDSTCGCCSASSLIEGF